MGKQALIDLGVFPEEADELAKLQRSDDFELGGIQEHGGRFYPEGYIKGEGPHLFAACGTRVDAEKVSTLVRVAV